MDPFETSQRLKNIKRETLQLFHQILLPLADNSTTDVDVAFRLKDVFQHNYAFFSFLYGSLAGIGICSNVYLLIKILHLNLYRNTLYFFLTHIAIVYIINCFIILPLSLVILLSRYWIFGNFMCYALILFQDLPNRLVLLTFALIWIERYRRWSYNILEPFPKRFALLAIWILGACLSLPACMFVEFYDLGDLFKHSKMGSLAVCIINSYSMEEYSRAMFLVLYVCPWGIIVFAFTRVSMELSKRDSPRNNNRQPGGVSNLLVENIDDDASAFSVNVEAMSRIHRLLMSAMGALFVCTLPLNILFLIQCLLVEDDPAKSARFDILYAALVWISFIPAITTPAFCLTMLNDGNQLLLDKIRDFVSFEYYRQRLTGIGFFHARMIETSTTLTTLSSPTVLKHFDCPSADQLSSSQTEHKS